MKNDKWLFVGAILLIIAASIIKYFYGRHEGDTYAVGAIVFYFIYMAN